MKTSAPHSDIEILGKDTHVLAICGNRKGLPKWLEDSPVCDLLRTHGIKHTGIMDAAPPYEILRVNQSGTFMMACLDGEGVVSVDGNWKPITAGQACLLPPFVKNSLKCLPGHRWRFAWVRYDESPETKPIVSSVSPVIGKFDGQGLKCAIEGLHAEAQKGTPAANLHWSALVNHYVIRFAEPTDLDERLWKLWNEVEKNPARDWTLDQLATIACLSPEHLRRLCVKEIGRSPMRHLSFIRLKHAVRLLTNTEEKIETIAKAVGFASIHSFSKSFSSWFGKRPSDFRN
ncbi:MAG: helix-turn-helix domain-containing protein [Akkermansiaceae bacterium]